MKYFTTDELQEAQRPLASLISKSEKSQQKLSPGTWQHTMLRDNLKALHIASALMKEESSEIEKLMQNDFQESLSAIAVMISRTGNALAKFLPGTSQHTLLKNRLQALRISEIMVKQELNSFS